MLQAAALADTEVRLEKPAAWRRAAGVTIFCVHRFQHLHVEREGGDDVLSVSILFLERLELAASLTSIRRLAAPAVRRCAR